MSGHTKGPWYLVGYGRMIRTSKDGTQGDTVCVLEANKGETQFKNSGANGRLIAAAPELLAVLKHMRNYFWSEGYADQTSVMALADAAIAEAEGE